MDLTNRTIQETRRALDAKEFSALELTNAYLSAITERDPELHAYLETWEDAARAEARAADGRIARGEIAPLTGIPLAIKDNILIKDRIASSASKMLEHYRASYDATVIEKLKGEGAVFLGRTNMDEFALGGSTENSAFGPSKNPLDTNRVPGGTSGGSAAAVGGNLALAALGSDTGGSIRQPASFCGIVGLKTTYGSVSRFGLMAAASSLDQIGPMGKTVADVKTVFNAIRGRDARDGTSVAESQYPVRPLKKVIGVPRALLSEGVDPDVLASFEATLETLRGAGYEVRDIELPSLKHALAVYYIVNPAEVSTNLARYDGIRYGLSLPADDIGGVYTKTRGAGFGPEVRRRILVGTFVLSSGYADAYYRKARDVRGMIRAEMAQAFEGIDAIATPTSPILPWKFGEKADPVSLYAADIFTVPVNLAGVPALSVPGGDVVREDKKLSVGFQLIGAHGAEEVLCQIGALVEKRSS